MAQTNVKKNMENKAFLALQHGMIMFKGLQLYYNLKAL
jgi:hypothetical protein